MAVHVTYTRRFMMVTTIGIDPHKATHTAVAIDESEAVLGEITVPADRDQTNTLMDWASELDVPGQDVGDRDPRPERSFRCRLHRSGP